MVSDNIKCKQYYISRNTQYGAFNFHWKTKSCRTSKFASDAYRNELTDAGYRLRSEMKKKMKNEIINVAHRTSKTELTARKARASLNICNLSKFQRKTLFLIGKGMHVRLVWFSKHFHCWSTKTVLLYVVSTYCIKVLII